MSSQENNWYVSIGTIRDGCYSIKNNLDKTPDIIIGIMRGGIVPAIMLSHMFNDVDVKTINYSSKKGRGESSDQKQLVLPEIKTGSTILIVDELVDSGNTLKDIVDEFNQIGEYTVYTSAVFVKKGAVFEPDFKHLTLDKNAPWLVFPWER